MSFSSKIKTEISKEEMSKPEAIAELSAFIRNVGILSKKNIEIHTENAAIARRLFSLIKDNFNINSHIITKRKVNENKTHIYSVIIEKKVEELLKDLEIIDNNNKKIEVPKEYLLDTKEETSAYLRGIFLSSGSVNDPKTARYHLEFLIGNHKHALFIEKLLNKHSLNSKTLKRNNKYMVYVKEAEKISDFLRMIRANSGVLYFEDIRIYRDHKNMTNRLNNCEQANVEKTLKTAKEQIDNIKLIKENQGLDTLEEKVRETAGYRLKYPESSLIELSEIISVETEHSVSKSGLNHRFRKIKQIAEKLK